MAGGEELRAIPLAEIDEGAIARDRSGLDGAAFAELRRSILVSGLRQPVEVFALAAPRGEMVWGLISGYRRLLAFRELLERRGEARFAAIPAFVRAPAGKGAALAAMVAENEVRSAVSAWGRGRVAVAARDAGAWPTVEAAVEGLYGHAEPAKRGRIRALARLVEALDGALPAPDALSERQALRLARAVQGGHGGVLRAALAGAGGAEQWRVLAPVLAACERAEAEAAAPAGAGGGWPRGAARRAREREAPARLVVRRERLRDGWGLRVTGPDATEGLAEAVMARLAWLHEPG